LEFIELAALLFVVALAAGVIDAMAGGGGLITVPALLWAGLPPVQALATNKAQSVFGSFAATLRFLRAGAIDLRAAARRGLHLRRRRRRVRWRCRCWPRTCSPGWCPSC
jgi:uncharacterized membrane protein YfcA